MKPKATIKTNKWKELRTRLPKGSVLQVGVLAGAGNAAGGISMIELAAIHEFGSPKNNIPQRSFIRSTLGRAEIVQQFKQMTARFAKQIVDGKLTEAQALGLLGAWMASQVKMTIKKRMTTGPDPQALKPATIARKKSDLPLVDTGRLINAITWSVKMGKG